MLKLRHILSASLKKSELDQLQKFGAFFFLKAIVD